MSAIGAVRNRTVAVIRCYRGPGARRLGRVGRLGDVALRRMVGSCRDGTCARARGAAPGSLHAGLDADGCRHDAARHLAAACGAASVTSRSPWAAWGRLILAYLAVWIVFGCIAYWGDSLLHELVEQVPSLGSFIAPGVLLLAGVYQLTPVKRACLARCRFEGAELPLSGTSTPGEASGTRVCAMDCSAWAAAGR